MKRSWSWGEIIACLLIIAAAIGAGCILFGLFASLSTRAHAAELDDWVSAQVVTRGHIAIVDGDTVRLDDDRLVRLQGYNSPEIFHPKCPAEKALGERAKARLIELAKAGARLTINPGSCAFGRACGTLTVLTDKVEDVGDVLIREHLAEPMVCPGGKCPPARDWCAG